MPIKAGKQPLPGLRLWNWELCCLFWLCLHADNHVMGDAPQASSVNQ